MTPEELGRALADEMYKHAATDRAEAATFTQNAKDFQKRADDARQTAAHFTSLADGWEQTADKLASGAITVGDAELVPASVGDVDDTEAAQLEAAKAYYTEAQIAGKACTDCGGPLADTAGGFVTGETPAGRMFEHIDPQDCIKYVAAMRAGDEAYAAGYTAAVDDAHVIAMAPYGSTGAESDGAR